MYSAGERKNKPTTAGNSLSENEWVSRRKWTSTTLSSATANASRDDRPRELDRGIGRRQAVEPGDVDDDRRQGEEQRQAPDACGGRIGAAMPGGCARPIRRERAAPCARVRGSLGLGPRSPRIRVDKMMPPPLRCICVREGVDWDGCTPEVPPSRTPGGTAGTRTIGAVPRPARGRPLVGCSRPSEPWSSAARMTSSQPVTDRDPRTIVDKIWTDHVVSQDPGAPAVLAVDLHLVHEVTSPQAFTGLRERGLDGPPARRRPSRPPTTRSRRPRATCRCSTCRRRPRSASSRRTAASSASRSTASARRRRASSTSSARSWA